MDEVRAESWPELHELLFADDWREELRRFRSNYAFRRKGDSGYDLRTRLSVPTLRRECSK